MPRLNLRYTTGNEVPKGGCIREAQYLFSIFLNEKFQQAYDRATMSRPSMASTATWWHGEKVEKGFSDFLL